MQHGWKHVERPGGSHTALDGKKSCGRNHLGHAHEPHHIEGGYQKGQGFGPGESDGDSAKAVFRIPLNRSFSPITGTCHVTALWLCGCLFFVWFVFVWVCF